jgi:molybdopterin molybdotransferase
MISVDEALVLIGKETRRLSPIKIPLSQALMTVLAEDAYAQTDVPPFHQSAMDGYAISFSDWLNKSKIRITGEIPAGIATKFKLEPGTAMKIFTGAVVPEGADTVVIRELADIDNDFLVIRDNNPARGKNVRLPGVEIKSGTIAAVKNTLMVPAAIGYLAGVGISQVSVYPVPGVSIIVTGNELQDPGKPLQPGQVYESNSFSLRAALQRLHITEIVTARAGDTMGDLTSTLARALENSDLVLLTGGVSAGDYDLVTKAADECGVNKIFHKVKQRPGKPLFFGKDGERMVFGLPGNPASVLTCFYEYVIPCIESMTGRKNIVTKFKASLTKEYQKDPGLTFFLKGFAEGNSVTPLDAQESFRMSSYARANCLIRLDEGRDHYRENDVVEVHLIP